MVKTKELTLKKSEAASRGYSRINPKTARELGVGRKEMIEVSTDDKSVKLMAERAKGVDVKEIRLNLEDMEEIGAGEGDKVMAKKAD